MKRLFIISALCLMSVVTWAQKGLPSVEVKDIDGNVVNVQSILDDFKVVAVSTDDSRSSAKVKPMVGGRGWTDFTILLDENSDLKRAMNVQTQPTVFVLDKDGNVVYTHTGYTPGSEEELFDQILKLQ